MPVIGPRIEVGNYGMGCVCTFLGTQRLLEKGVDEVIIERSDPDSIRNAERKVNGSHIIRAVELLFGNINEVLVIVVREGMFIIEPIAQCEKIKSEMEKSFYYEVIFHRNTADRSLTNIVIAPQISCESKNGLSETIMTESAGP